MTRKRDTDWILKKGAKEIMDHDIYKGVPSILTAKDVAEFWRIGMNQAYEIIHEIGFRYGRTVRCTKTLLIGFVEGCGRNENDENLRPWTDQAKA